MTVRVAVRSADVRGSSWLWNSRVTTIVWCSTRLYLLSSSVWVSLRCCTQRASSYGRKGLTTSPDLHRLLLLMVCQISLHWTWSRVLAELAITRWI